MKTRLLFLAIAGVCASLARAAAVPLPVPDAARSLARVDLATHAGAAQVHAAWSWRDASVVPAQFTAPGADGQPGTTSVGTQDLRPRGDDPGFAGAGWHAIEPQALAARRGNGRLSFVWYRAELEIPETLDGVATRGSTIVLEVEVDDYAEVWVDGELPRPAAQGGGPVIAGWNAPNRIVVARDAQPGQHIRVAIFGANGPLSAPPTNYVYLRRARLELHAADTAVPYAVPPQEVNVTVERADPRIDAIVPANPKLYKLAEGFRFTEGPVWVPREGGYLLFSDPNANRIYRYSDTAGLSVFREASGYEGSDIAEYRQPGSNGITLDPQGRISFDQHGNRRVVRLEQDGSLSVLADRDDGKRLNSPNDLVFRSDGSLYFTDPFFGLPRFGDDPRRELPYQGVYRVAAGKLSLLTRELAGPNGIAFSPDERFLYVGNWDDRNKVVMRYPVRADGTLGTGTVFHDLTAQMGEDAIDGIKVDTAGNVYVSGPGGLWIFDAGGVHLGTVKLPRHPHNFGWGDDGHTLYLCAQDRLYRMRLLTRGVYPAASLQP